MKSKLLIYLLPVMLSAFLIYGYSTQDDPSRDVATIEKATNSFAEFKSSVGITPAEDNLAVLYSQDELISNPGGGFGGANASAITDPGTLFGYGNQGPLGNRMADDFTVPAGQTWTIDSIIVFHYQTGSTTTSTINNVTLQIWNGATPGTGSVVAGDSTTNRLVSSYFSNIYRVTATTLTNNQRPVMRNQINMNGASLPAGTYWIDYAAGGTLASGPWNPPRTIPGQPVTGNAYQRLGTTFAWAPAVDGANAQGVPFIIYGSTGGQPTGGSVTVTRNQTKVILDNTGNANPMVDTITVSGIAGAVEIKKVTLTIGNVQHTWIGDLRFWLSKDAITDTTISRVGWTGTGFGNSCDNFIGTILSDSAGLVNIQNIPTTCVGGQAQATGNFNPKSPLGVFANNGTNPNGNYILRISDNAAGDTGSLRSWTLKIDYDVITGVNNNITSIPNEFSLSQNYPNPFNPSTKISYTIPSNGLVTLKIFNMLGKEVASLVNEVKSAGTYEVNFNAANLSSGVYFYRLESGNFVDTKKMFLLK